MVWLDVVEEGGNSLYLEVLHREQQRLGGRMVERVSALLGDGVYEGEVFIEWGNDFSLVTFNDHWLQPHLIAEFFTRIHREDVEAALVTWCRSLRNRLHATLPRPARQRRNSRGSLAQTARPCKTSRLT